MSERRKVVIPDIIVSGGKRIVSSGMGESKRRIIVLDGPKIMKAGMSAKNWKKLGWKQTYITLIVKDYKEEIVDNRRMVVRSSGPIVGTMKDVTVTIGGGVVSIPDFWVRPSGSIFIAVETGSFIAKGVSFYKVPSKGGLRFEVTQNSKEIQKTQASQDNEVLADSSTVAAGFKLGLKEGPSFKLGTDRKVNMSNSTGKSTSNSLTERVPLKSLKITQV